MVVLEWRIRGPTAKRGGRTGPCREKRNEPGEDEETDSDSAEIRGLNTASWAVDGRFKAPKIANVCIAMIVEENHSTRLIIKKFIQER